MENQISWPEPAGVLQQSACVCYNGVPQ